MAARIFFFYIQSMKNKTSFIPTHRFYYQDRTSKNRNTDQTSDNVHNHPDSDPTNVYSQYFFKKNTNELTEAIAAPGFQDFSLCMMLSSRREANQSAVARQIFPDSSCSLHLA